MSSAIFERDFDRLAPGSSLETSGRTITEADVTSFAALTGDWHPQHADAAWAAESPFGERIAHGMLVVSYAIGLLPIDPDRVVALRAVRDVVFKRPVPIGTTIRVEAEVAGLRPLGDEQGLVTLALRVRDSAGALLARLAVEALWRRGPVGEDGRPASAAGANGAAAAAEGRRTGAEDELSPLRDGRVLL
ncbi:MAG: MaoC/PaaZ C-terminal domain-containing protein [Solirubrobacterales bacterium]